MKLLISISSFLLGYFIFLTFYGTYYKNIENFVSKETKLEEVKDDSNDAKNNINDEIELPNKSDLLMYLSSYNDNVINEKLKWYSESDTNNDDKSEILNKGSFFSFNNIIQFKPFILNEKIIGANINNIILSGPDSEYFSNNIDTKKDLKYFTIMFHIKINKLSESNTLYEMICNTTTKYDKDKEEEVYIPNSVYIKLNRIKDDIYNIVINIGSKKYTIDDINDNIFNSDITFMSLKLDDKKIVFILNENIYNFDYDSYDLITSNQPVIINKKGNIDGILYNFAYYKDSITIGNINKYKKYVNFYIYGANNIVSDKNKISKDLSFLKEKYETTMIDNKKLLENLQKCVDNNK
jgi:hypothetical protein